MLAAFDTDESSAKVRCIFTVRIAATRLHTRRRARSENVRASRTFFIMRCNQRVRKVSVDFVQSAGRNTRHQGLLEQALLLVSMCEQTRCAARVRCGLYSLPSWRPLKCNGAVLGIRKVPEHHRTVGFQRAADDSPDDGNHRIRSERGSCTNLAGARLSATGARDENDATWWGSTSRRGCRGRRRRGCRRLRGLAAFRLRWLDARCVRKSPRHGAAPSDPACLHDFATACGFPGVRPASPTGPQTPP